MSEVDVLVEGRRIESPVEQGEVSSWLASREDDLSVDPVR